MEMKKSAAAGSAFDHDLLPRLGINRRGPSQLHLRPPHQFQALLIRQYVAQDQHFRLLQPNQHRHRSIPRVDDIPFRKPTRLPHVAAPQIGERGGGNEKRLNVATGERSI